MSSIHRRPLTAKTTAVAVAKAVQSIIDAHETSSPFLLGGKGDDSLVNSFTVAVDLNNGDIIRQVEVTGTSTVVYSVSVFVPGSYFLFIKKHNLDGGEDLVLGQKA